MKIIAALSCLCLSLICSCTGSDDIFLIDDGEPIGMENELLTEYPYAIDSLVKTQLEVKLGKQFQIISKKVYNLAIHQTEPTDRVYIDRKEFLIYVRIKDISKKLSNYTLHFYKNSDTDFILLSLENN